ncbi:MAG: nucleotidyl transferase AbiEii/AbiGii toxin family protein [Maricaulaceae bacterium]
MKNNITYLAIEVFYSQLAVQFPDRFLVTGSFANQAWLGESPRPIQDLDLLETQPFESCRLKSDIEKFVSDLRDENGIVWARESLVQKTIFEDSNVPGVRSVIDFTYEDQAHSLQIDIAKQDPLTQSPVTVFVPSCLSGILKLTTVPAETAAAWKLHGLFEHLDGRWLPKSLIDLYRFIKSGSLSEREFRIAVLMAFQSRLDPLVCLNRLINDNFGVTKSSKLKWENEIATIGEDWTMESVLEEVRAFIKPLFSLSHAFEITSNSELIEHRVRLLHELKSNAADIKLSGLKARLRVLPQKAYNRIGHLPGSKGGVTDRHIHIRESERLIETCPEGGEVFVQEKLDGSCVAVYRRGREILPLGREGDITYGSANSSRRMWADWVKLHQDVFMDILKDGEWLCGEWIAMVHSVRYQDVITPFYAFDLFSADGKALSYDNLLERLEGSSIPTPALLHRGGALSIEAALELLKQKAAKSKDPAEGAVWRLEHEGVPKLMAKYVRADFEAGQFLEEKTGEPIQWNWHLDISQSRYAPNLRLSRLIHKKGNARIAGFDDAPHKRHVDTVIHVNGIITNPAVFEGMISGIVDANGLNATFVLADMILNSKFDNQLHAILIDGITFAFNTVDLTALNRMINIPVIAVMRHEPNLKRIFKVIEKYCEDTDEYKRLYKNAGTIFQHDKFFFQCCGLSEDQAHIILDQATVTGHVPESLRIAHLIGSSIKTGQSSRSA